MPIPTTAPRRIPATGQREVRLIAKAGGKDQLAVYGADGTLLGTCDLDALNALASPPGQPGKPSEAQTNANAAKVQANTAAGQQQAAAAEVQKAMAELLHAVRPRPRVAGEVRKAATTLDQQYDQMLKELGSSHAQQVKSVIANEALRMQIGGGVKGAKAVNVCKRAAVQYAVRRGLV